MSTNNKPWHLITGESGAGKSTAILDRMKDIMRRSDVTIHIIPSSQPDDPYEKLGEGIKQCANCAYFVGDVSEGRLMVCGFYPYGKEQCEDFTQVE